jgi:uncharacterized protein YbjT (DUF2867 family)
MILVVGATGELGGAVCRALLDRDEAVRVLVRPGTEYGRLQQAGAQPMMGDLKDGASVGRACADVHTVVTTANSAGRGGADTVASVDLHGNAALVDAARAAGVAHFVFVSALGATETSPVPFLQAKASTERRVRESGMTYTIVQPNIFMDVWVPMMVGLPLQEDRAVNLIGRGDHRHAFVARDDVARLVTACVGNAAAANRTLPLCGPDALSWTEVVAIVRGISGRDVAIDYVPAGTPLPGLPPVVAGLAATFETYETVIDTKAVAAEFGVRLTPIDEFLRGMLTPPPLAA